MQDGPRITPASWAMVATLGLIWGGTFLLIEVALRGITPFWLAAGRIGFAALLTVSVWLVWRPRLWLGPARNWPALGLVGALSTAVPFMCLSWGQQFVTSGFAGVSMAAVALMVMPLAHVLVPGERMTPRRVAGVTLGFAGVCVLLGGQALAQGGGPMEHWGRLACLSAAACYAVSSVTMRRLPPVDPIGLAAVPLIIGTAVVVPTAWVLEGPPPLPDTTTLAVLALLGLVPTAGANLLRVLLIRSAGPGFMSLVNYQVPVWSVILGIVLLNEPLRPALFAALGLILAGLAVGQWASLRGLITARRA